MSSQPIVADYQIPRNSLAWMLVAQAAVIAPHVMRLPVWVTLVCIGCGWWRIMVYQGRWSYPGRWVKVAFVFCGLAGIPLGYDKIYALEPAIALLIIAFVLKLLEMHHKRDAYIVILLGYFVAITEFLFFQSIPYALYMLVAVTLITTALIGLHQTKTHLKPFQTLKIAVVLLAQSIPLMIVLFVLFPRISPLWTVPIQTGIAKTGVTDSMSPGDISALAQSDALAFKATFSSTPPSFSRLYWRGLVLSEFDGTTWTQDPLLRRSVWRYRQAEPDWINQIEYFGEGLKYEIILEASQQNWLFSLAMPELPKDRDYVILRDFRMASAREIRQRTRYDVVSHLDYAIERSLSDFYRYRYTRIPEGSNTRTQDLAKEMFSRAPDAREYIDDVLRMFNQQQFVYTLNPPLLGDNGIDEFLLETRRGFCEHYAGSFVFMMRAAGIPARVVVGYQGGEYNPRGNYVAVRQFDAHAWTEVWLKGRGWIRFDPTSAVAPDRVERGLEAAVENEDSFLQNSPLSIFRYRQLLWLTDLRLQLDSIGHYWDSWVVGYTPERQLSVLTEYLGKIDRKRLGTIMLATFFSLLAIIGLFVLSKRTKAYVAPLDKEYLKFCRIMAKAGFARETGEGPLDYAKRLAAEMPELQLEVNVITREYVRMNYLQSGVDAKKLSGLGVIKKAIRVLKFKTLTTSL